ncbi:MAG: hypothetical protein QNK04_07170 [Myxococcota bacterium]|nr:hypothetical protein [Myxococcota bacterium]
MQKRSLLVAGACLACLLAGCATQEGPGGQPQVPESAEQQLERLARAGRARARDHLEVGNQFAAFALVMERDGRVRRVESPLTSTGGVGERRRVNDPTRAYAELVEELRANRSDYQAVGIFAVASVAVAGRQTRAVKAGLEHESGTCEQRVVPFRRSAARRLTHGEPVRSKREGEVFDCR